MFFGIPHGGLNRRTLRGALHVTSTGGDLNQNAMLRIVTASVWCYIGTDTTGMWIATATRHAVYGCELDTINVRPIYMTEGV